MAYTNSQRRQHILEIQQYLYSISFFNDKIPQILPDGVYDKSTAAAVAAFQREYGLPVTGNTDSATWSKIVSVYRDYLNSAPAAYHVFPSRNFVAHKGDRGELIYVIQAMLNSIGMSYDNMKPPAVCGEYDPETSEAVRQFQRRVGLPQSGMVDSKTWNMLVHFCEHMERQK